MTDTQGLADLMKRGVVMLFDMVPEFLRVQFPPMAPTGFGGQRTRFLGGQIPVHGAPADIKTPGGLGFGAAIPDEFYHAFAQVKAVCFHARQSITLCANVNLKCYTRFRRLDFSVIDAVCNYRFLTPRFRSTSVS